MLLCNCMYVFKERVEAGEVCISFDSVANVCRVFGLCK